MVRTDIEYYFLEKYVRGKDDSEIANVTYRDENGDIRVSPSQEVSFDLSECVFPAYENGVILRDKDNYHRIVGFLSDDVGNEDDKFYYRKTRAAFLKQLDATFLKKKAIITTGRWCRYKCTYCYRWAKYSKVRQLPIETIRKDLDVLKDCGFKTVYVYDDCFTTTNFDRMDEIVELFASYDFEYQIAVRYETCTEENLNLLKNLKLSFVQIGLQSASKETNAKIGRNFHLERMKKVVYFLKENGAYVSLDVILGLPWETFADFIETYNTALSFAPNDVTVNSLFLNPGTKLFDEVDNYGIKTKETDPYNVPGILESETFPREDVLKAREYVKRSMDFLPNTHVTLR